VDDGKSCDVSVIVHRPTTTTTSIRRANETRFWTYLEASIVRSRRRGRGGGRVGTGIANTLCQGAIELCSRVLTDGPRWWMESQEGVRNLGV
jgi:hypothetical protein